MLRMLHDREEEAVKKVTRMVDHLNHKLSIEGGGGASKNKYRTRLAQPSFYQKSGSYIQGVRKKVTFTLMLKPKYP